MLRDIGPLGWRRSRVVRARSWAKATPHAPEMQPTPTQGVQPVDSAPNSLLDLQRCPPSPTGPRAAAVDLSEQQTLCWPRRRKGDERVRGPQYQLNFSVISHPLLWTEKFECCVCVIIAGLRCGHGRRRSTARPWQGGQRGREKAPCAGSPENIGWICARGLLNTSKCSVQNDCQGRIAHGRREKGLRSRAAAVSTLHCLLSSYRLLTFSPILCRRAALFPEQMANAEESVSEAGAGVFGAAEGWEMAEERVAVEI